MADSAEGDEEPAHDDDDDDDDGWSLDLGPSEEALVELVGPVWRRKKKSEGLSACWYEATVWIENRAGGIPNE